jgi:hypothetical protein
MPLFQAKAAEHSGLLLIVSLKTLQTLRNVLRIRLAARFQQQVLKVRMAIQKPIAAVRRQR